MTLELALLVCVAFSLGGVLKGATGAGAPFFAVPLMAILVDVPFAVAVFLIPNVISNAWQIWHYRDDFPETRFAARFALAGVVGAGIGTVALAGLSSAILVASVAIIVLVYVAFRLMNPAWKLDWVTANKIVLPVGTIGGFFQGAIGLSAPVSITFMNAVRLERRAFIATMSLYFFAMALIQFPTQVVFGIMTFERFVYSALATIPLLAGLPIGNFLARHLSSKAFDRIILGVLTLLALRLLARAIA